VAAVPNFPAAAALHRGTFTFEETTMMRVRTLSTTVLAAALAAALAGCESTKLNEPSALAPVESRNTAAARPATAPAAPAAAQSAVNTVDLANRSGAGAAAGTAAMSLPNQRVVYFDFDSFAIRDEFKPVVDGHAKVLTGSRNRKMVIEGHTDERGGREYNLALGQKRAEAVARSLELLGVSGGQIEAVSFGKERPAVAGADEAAWAKNRRAELKDR
jgi:peptidoglycan-associated lipoprotein